MRRRQLTILLPFVVCLGACTEGVGEREVESDSPLVAGVENSERLHEQVARLGPAFSRLETPDPQGDFRADLYAAVASIFEGTATLVNEPARPVAFEALEETDEVNPDDPLWTGLDDASDQAIVAVDSDGCEIFSSLVEEDAELTYVHLWWENLAAQEDANIAVFVESTTGEVAARALRGIRLAPPDSLGSRVCDAEAHKRIDLTSRLERDKADGLTFVVASSPDTLEIAMDVVIEIRGQRITVQTTFEPAKLATLRETIPDELAIDARIGPFATDDDSCRFGLLRGRWVRQDVGLPDRGAFVGQWGDFAARHKGHIAGVWGRRIRGSRATTEMVALVIDGLGLVTHVMTGSVALDGADTGGGFRGGWGEAKPVGDSDVEGIIAGHFDFADDESGFFLGRWGNGRCAAWPDTFDEQPPAPKVEDIVP